jgi:hypothetical protein
MKSASLTSATCAGRSLARGQLVQARHQFGGGELGWNVPAEIMHGQQPGEPGDQRLWARTHPIRRPPQMLLLSEPTEITPSA